MIRPERTALRLLALLASVGVLLVLAEFGLRHARAASLLLSVVEQHDPSGITDWVKRPVAQHTTTLAIRGRSLRAYVYAPNEDSTTGSTHGTVILLHGVHPDGIDEPRLQAFARALASIGVQTFTPELPELTEQHVLPSTIKDIGACIAEVHARARRKPGAIGISFAGGLLLLAASEPPADEQLAYAVTVGAHHDLRRVLRYYAGESIAAPDGAAALGRTDPYGARVMVTAYTSMFFAPEDSARAEQALKAFLKGRYSDARALAAQLSPHGRDRFDVATSAERRGELSELLLSAAQERERDLLEVSPARGLRGLRAPAFLLHGQSDPIVPSIETRWLAQEVPEPARAGVLITPVLRHAEASTPSLRENLALVRFVARFLGE